MPRCATHGRGLLCFRTTDCLIFSQVWSILLSLFYGFQIYSLTGRGEVKISGFPIDFTGYRHSSRKRVKQSKKTLKVMFSGI